MARCEECGLRIRGKNHEQGSHHKKHMLAKALAKALELKTKTAAKAL